ncbi:tripartite tricarboxylate transporter substrate binding protein [Ramlibacter tataouinensis]|uniref:Candidate extracytoplasmic binding receptor n=1 Tax=Ramlibacter tataouinensis (strain ATCC BAA-407 / DSM 14655 / LMG 21543 / TTB310) TaxID=365046 RepID=F5XZ90_RAMTT|nr:tripartite tricarboxylate transporter substrate binding protein [Ramlibacter tataouinensis]AEG93260.1 Candidate extracytoplasmic binding receptor [Ramlibacter tataouinensis TTB310]
MSAFLDRRALALLIPALALAPLVAIAQTSDWKPDRTVTIVVPYSPGGGTDAQARAVAQELAKVWGQSVVIENVPGADGLIGTKKVMAAKPDGHTLLVQINSIAVMKHIPASKGFDPVPDLVPVSVFSQLPGVFVTTPSLPGKTLAEVVRHCKASPQPCSFGTTESVARLQARQLAVEAGLDNMVVVNYKGGGQLITDLLAGNVNMAIMGVTAALPHYKSGALKIQATLGSKRASVTPNVPSAVEAGFPSMDTITWYGLFAPKGTPKNVADGIASAVAKAVKGEATSKTFGTLGAEALGTTSAEFATIVQKEVERMDALAKRFPLE